MFGYDIFDSNSALRLFEFYLSFESFYNLIKLFRNHFISLDCIG